MEKHLRAHTAKKLYDDMHHIQADIWGYWVKNTFLKWDFWISVSLIFVFWAAFFLFRKKDSTARLFLVILFVICITSWLDFLGVAMGLWYYNGDVFPTIPSFLVWDCSMLPILIVLIFQFKGPVHPVRKGLFFAAICAFIGEPIFIHTHFYVPDHWTPLYSFPIYFVIYVMAHKIGQAKSFAPLK